MLNKLIRDKDGKVVIWQAPNLPLWVWIITTTLGFVLHGSLKSVTGYVGTTAIAIWAALEVRWGASPIRRIVGGIVLIAMVVGAVRKLIG